MHEFYIIQFYDILLRSNSENFIPSSLKRQTNPVFNILMMDKK